MFTGTPAEYAAAQAKAVRIAEQIRDPHPVTRLSEGTLVMPSTDAIITDHINAARDRINHARRQHAAAAEQDRPAWQIQINADEQSLNALLALQDQVRGGADPVALSERRREELRRAAEAADPDDTHESYVRGAAGGVAHKATAMRALAPFTAMGNLHSALRQASRTGV